MSAKTLSWWGRLLLVAGVSVAGLVACGDRVTEAQLADWQAEAIAENQRLRAEYGDRAEQQQWQLTIQGQIQADSDVVLGWPALQALAKTEVLATDPNFKQSQQVFRFRGVPVSTVLDQVDLEPGVQEITFAAFDGFREALPLTVLNQYPISLAIERDGQLIPRSEGGPLYLIFPNVSMPELAGQYTGINWVFYVTHIIVGTEELNLRVNHQGQSRDFNRTELEALPPVTLSTEVGYRLFWPNKNVILQGVRIQDVLAEAGVTVTPETVVTVLGKVPIHHDPNQPIQVTGEQLATCDLLLVTRWGDRLSPIPAKMGGPITLAFSPACPSPLAQNQPWTIFVESLEVKTP